MPLYFDAQMPDERKIAPQKEKYKDELFWDEQEESENLADDFAEPQMPDFSFLEETTTITNEAHRSEDYKEWMKRFIDINSDIFLKDMPIKRIGEGG